MGEIVYIGYTESIKTRMSNHFKSKEDWYGNSVLSLEQISEVTYIDYTETGSANARVLEAYLIAKEKPEWNKDFVEKDDLTFTLQTGELEWKKWELRNNDNPHHHIFVWKDDELLYEIPKVGYVYTCLCMKLGLCTDMNFGYSTPVYDNGYKLMRLSGKRRIKTGKQTQKAKYSFMGYPEAFLEAI